MLFVSRGTIYKESVDVNSYGPTRLILTFSDSFFIANAFLLMMMVGFTFCFLSIEEKEVVCLRF